jgi:adenine-specific DNA-methyltransferase
MPSKKDIKNYKQTGKRKNIPEVGLVSSATDKVGEKKKYAFDPYLDPQLQWSGKVEKNELEIDTVSLHVHERIDPKTLIEKLKSKSESKVPQGSGQLELNFFDNPGFEKPLNKALQFYEHEQDWSNRLIAGDSLLVMNSLLEKEGMAGKIQTIFMDPPYGVNYRSNFQPFTNKKDHKDGSDDSIPHEPEMIRAFRDTWELGTHSYLSHIRERVLLCRELLNERGSFFFQISDDNLHHCREIIDEIFGPENYFGTICFQKTASPLSAEHLLPSKMDFIIWYAKDKSKIKYHKLFFKRANDIQAGYSKIQLPDGEIRNLTKEEKSGEKSIPPKSRLLKYENLFKSGPGSKYDIEIDGKTYNSGNRWWGQKKEDILKLYNMGRIAVSGNSLSFVKYLDDFPYKPIDNLWDGLGGAQNKVYVVQTNEEVIKRCVLMTSNAGEIIFDPTCGGGTTAVAAERLGRKWITCDTSRVALNLARKRIMTEVYDYYKLQNPDEGLSGGLKYKEVDRLTPSLIAKGHSGKKETIYLEPQKDSTIKRVTGPFTVEAVPSVRVKNISDTSSDNFEQDIENYINEISSTGIQTLQGKKINFINIEKTKGFQHIHAVGQIEEENAHKTAYVCFGPDYAPMEQTQIEHAVFELREILDEDCVLIFCAFHFDPEASKDIDHLNHEKITFLKSQMSVDLLTEDLRKKRSSNQSFWLIGQPDIEIKQEGKQYKVEIRGFDYYNPSKGQIESKGIDGIALWMIDTNYDERSVCPDQFFFPIEDNNDWTKLKRSLKEEIDVEKIDFYQGSVSELFDSGDHKKIAVKIVDNRGIESLIVRELP